jgi:hypothetical protein
MNITIPDIPSSLNPKGLEVEISSIGEQQKGEWPLVFLTMEAKWVRAKTVVDDGAYITARLVEPKYMFLGELKTESECLAILEREYECFPDCGKCEGCPFQIVGEPCLLPDSLQAWRKKQPVEEWIYDPTDEDACKRPIVQVRDKITEPWSEVDRVLVATAGKRYYTRYGGNVSVWNFCRMKKENK